MQQKEFQTDVLTYDLVRLSLKGAQGLRIMNQEKHAKITANINEISRERFIQADASHNDH
jgi:hypothetical protein